MTSFMSRLFLLGEFHGQRSLAPVHGIAKSRTQLSNSHYDLSGQLKITWKTNSVQPHKVLWISTLFTVRHWFKRQNIKREYRKSWRVLLAVLLMCPKELWPHPPAPPSDTCSLSLCLPLSHSIGERLKHPSHPLDLASGHPTESSAYVSLCSHSPLFFPGPGNERVSACMLNH